MTGRPTRYDQMDEKPIRHDRVDAIHGMTGKPMIYDQASGKPTRDDRANGRHMGYDKVHENQRMGERPGYSEVDGKPLQYNQVGGKPTKYSQLDATHGTNGKPARYDQMDGTPMRYTQMDAVQEMTGKATTHEQVDTTHGIAGRLQKQQGRAPTYKFSDRADHQWNSHNAGHMMTVGSIPLEDGLSVKQRMAQQLHVQQQWDSGSPSKKSDNGGPVKTTTLSPTRTSPSRSLRDRLQLQDKSEWVLAQRREQQRTQSMGSAIIKPDLLIIHRDEQQREMQQNQVAASQSARERLSHSSQPASTERHSNQDSDRDSGLQRSSSRLTDVSDSSSQFFEFSPTYKSWIDKYGSLENKPGRQPKKKEAPPSPQAPSTPRPHHKLPNYNTYVRAITHDYNDYKSSLPAVPLSPTPREVSEVSSAWLYWTGHAHL